MTLLCLPSEEVETCWFTFDRTVSVGAFSPSSKSWLCLPSREFQFKNDGEISFIVQFKKKIGWRCQLLWLHCHREVKTCCFTSVHSVCAFCPIHFCLFYRACGQTQDVVPMLAHRLRHWPNISPVFGYRVVFGATLNVGKRHRRRANINPALVQSIVLVQPAWSTDYGWMDTAQHRRRWPNI